MNFGSLLRSAAFFGVAGAICEQGTSRLTPVASEASNGAGEEVPLFHTDDLAPLLVAARTQGWSVAGTALASAEEGGASLRDWLPACTAGIGAVVLVFGPEGAGLRQELQACCSVLLRIEGGHYGLDSLNVGVAAGIATHAVRRALGSPPPAALKRM